MNDRRRPSRLWLFFIGRRRRGFPGLLVGVLLAAVLLGLTFGIRGGAAVGYWIGIFFLGLIALLVVAALAIAIVAVLRPPGRR